MTRDPYLPSPEICDWLLEQEWSKPATMHVSGPDCRSEIYECCRATAALGADECIDLVLPVEGIEMLREDQRQRRETPEQRVEKLNRIVGRVAAATDKTAARKLTVADIDELIDNVEGGE